MCISILDKFLNERIGYEGRTRNIFFFFQKNFYKAMILFQFIYLFNSLLSFLFPFVICHRSLRANVKISYISICIHRINIKRLKKDGQSSINNNYEGVCVFCIYVCAWVCMYICVIKSIFFFFSTLISFLIWFIISNLSLFNLFLR